jgi:hypothetical protein
LVRLRVLDEFLGHAKREGDAWEQTERKQGRLKDHRDRLNLRSANRESPDSFIWGRKVAGSNPAAPIERRTLIGPPGLRQCPQSALPLCEVRLSAQCSSSACWPAAGRLAEATARAVAFCTRLERPFGSLGERDLERGDETGNGRVEADEDDQLEQRCLADPGDQPRL